MERKRASSTLILRLLTFGCLVLIPAAASAQITGIAGVVRDDTGAVLPGVIVEATSPVLIERVRSVTTDDHGQYKIIDLRPGTYAVTFTLPGFSTVKRERIELTAAFTATVNADLKVGAIEETITVSGASPIVDTHNVVEQRVMSRGLIEDLPTARNFEGLAQIIPGLMQVSTSKSNGQDVGGSTGERGRLTVHGGRSTDNLQTIEGLSYQQLDQSGSSSHYAITPGEVQEFSYELSGLSAENPYGNVYVNMIPREGANTFHGSFLALYGDKRMESNNLSDDLIARGLLRVNGQDKLAEVNPSFGGPIMQDKLWFFASTRYNIQNETVAGMYENLTPTAFTYTPDLSRPSISDNWMYSVSGRLTWQASQKNKFSGYYAWNPFCQCHRNITATVAPEASIRRHAKLNKTATVSWRSTVSSRVLIEAGVLIHRSGFWNNPIPGVSTELSAVTEQSTGLVFRAPPTISENQQLQRHYRAAMSYVTGAHAFKFGFDRMDGMKWGATLVNNGMTLQLNNGMPRQITVFNTPRINEQHLDAMTGLYAQDQWTLNRLTISAGIRYDALNASVPALHLPAGPFVPERDFPAVSNIPAWKDISPRVGVAYDLLGNGKTAVKATWSRYIVADKVGFAAANEPSTLAVVSATRVWGDANRDFVPQANELGPLSNGRFGQAVTTTRYDDSVREGWGVRPFNWEGTVGIQQQLLSGMSVNVTFFRRAFGNFTLTDNLALTPADYDPYCVTAPVDPRLPGGGDNQICGLYEVKAAKFGQVDNLVTQASTFGDLSEVFKGIDATINLRLARGVIVSGGLSSGTSSNLGNETLNSRNTCVVVDSPGALTLSTGEIIDQRFCDADIPWRTGVKFLGTVPLPWNFQAAATFQSNPGPQITATYRVPNAAIAATLGRNPGSAVDVQLVAPGTMYGERLNQVDARLSRSFAIGPTRIRGSVDVFNVLNGNAVILQNNQYGAATWQRPQFILPGRIAKLGIQVDF